MCCEKCSEGSGATTTDKMICTVCGKQTPVEELFNGMCKKCLKKYMDINLIAIRVCAKCGKQIKYDYKYATSPCCHAPILLIHKLVKIHKRRQN